MMRCAECEAIFEDGDIVYETVCWEDYYGVSSMFESKHYGSVATCPHCGSEEIEDYWEDDEDDEEEVTDETRRT